MPSRSKSSQRWLKEHFSDPYVKKAQAEGMRSRAAYKLEELVERDKLLKPGMVVVDLGAAPGGWSQWVRQELDVLDKGRARPGRVIASDILEMPSLAGVEFLHGDFREDAVLQQLVSMLGGRPVDVVVSDMAPNLSGVGVTDAARVELLIELAIDFAQSHLKPEGALVCKVFHGGGYAQLVELFRQHFRVVKPFKPKASRDKSSETFLVGIGLKRRSA